MARLKLASVVTLILVSALIPNTVAGGGPNQTVTMSIQEGSGPFTVGQLLHFDVVFPKKCELKAIQVDISAHDGSTAIYSDLSEPYEIRLRDDGRSVWASRGYPTPASGKAQAVCSMNGKGGTATYVLSDPVAFAIG